MQKQRNSKIENREMAKKKKQKYKENIHGIPSKCTQTHIKTVGIMKRAVYKKDVLVIDVHMFVKYISTVPLSPPRINQID